MVEYGRRLTHVSGTLVPAGYLAGLYPWRVLQYLIAGGAVLAVVLEAVRLKVGLDWWVYERLTREYEQDSPAGYALAVVAGAIVAWSTPPVVAVPALLMLTIADPFAGVLSTVSGPDTTKGWPVAVATFVVCVAIAAPFLPPRAAVPAAVVAVAADALKPRVFGYVIDDNFSIPVGAAATAYLAVEFLPTVVCEGSCLAGVV